MTMSVRAAIRCLMSLLSGQKHSGSQVVTSHVLRAARDLARVYCAHILNGARLICGETRAINKPGGSSCLCAGCAMVQIFCKPSRKSICELHKGLIRAWDPDRREEGKSGWQWEETTI